MRPSGARRELREETGIEVDDLGPVVHERETRFEFDGGWIDSRESYFVVRVDSPAIAIDGWTDLEREVMVDFRWWSIDELRVTADTVFPEQIVELLETHG